MSTVLDPEADARAAKEVVDELAAQVATVFRAILPALAEYELVIGLRKKA